MRAIRLLELALDIVPDLDDRIVFQCGSSPLTYHRYALTQDGAIYGGSLAGAATHGPGVEAVMISGARAAEALVLHVLGATSLPSCAASV